MPDSKTQSLRARHSFNSAADKVRAPLFGENPFFDPCDLVQVRYEMLRAVWVDGESVVEAADRFGVTRQTWYRAAWSFEREGLAGLVPDRPGPKNPRKLLPGIVDDLVRIRRRDPAVTYRQLAEIVERRWGVRVHQQSVARAIARSKKG
jgi:transposase